MRLGARRYAFVFVCQQGDLELKALLLAASLRRFLRCDYESIAAVPSPPEDWGTPSRATFAALDEMQVRPVEIRNEFGAEYPIGNKLSGFDVATDADKIVLLDSDIIMLREFGDQPRFAIPFNAKPADLQTFSRDEAAWRVAYETAGAQFPSMRFPSTVSREFGPPYFNSGFVAVDASVKFGEAWRECCHKVRADARVENKAVWLDQIALPVAIAKLGLAYDCLDERYNYPAHLKPLEAQRAPYFCHYHTAEVFAREPALRDLLRSLIEEHSWLADVLHAHRNWHGVLPAGGTITAEPGWQLQSSAPSPRRGNLPNLIITGIPRSGTSYLCNLLHRHSNCVIVNEPTEIFPPLMQHAVPWEVARLYSQLRSDVLNRKSITNKIRQGKIVEDTLGRDERETYHPTVTSADFILGTKNTLSYLARLEGLRRVLPDARIVACVRNPIDTIASWKTSFPHLRDVALTELPVGHPNDPSLTHRQTRELKLIMATPEFANRRAMWWNYLAERVLEQGRTIILVRYHELIRDPQTVLAEILDGWPKGDLLEEPLPSIIRSRRDQLDAAEEQAIHALCGQAAAELQVADVDCSQEYLGQRPSIHVKLAAAKST
ncbi:MAG: sulfotransferase [Chthoniobacterales bacterium]